MGRVKTNNTSLAYCIESALGVATTLWKLLEPNAVNKYGATIETVARSPISKNRQRRKGAVVNLTSAVEFEHDITREVFEDFAEGFVMASFQTGSQIFTKVSESDTLAAVASGSKYTWATANGAGALVNTLLFARGFTTAANNGLKVVVSSGTSTTAAAVAETLANESPTAVQHASVSVAGHRGAVGDLEIDASGDLISTTLDFTTLGLSAGQMIHIGGLVAANQFATAANFGYARIDLIAAHKITLSKCSTTFVADNGATKQIDILYGRFLKNVSVDDAKFLERSFGFELTMPGLANPTADMFIYSKGNFCDEMTLELPLNGKATVTFAMQGTDTIDPTASRLSGASTPTQPVQTSAFATTSDLARLRIQKVDETGITTCFKSATVKLRNNVSPENCLGTLGATYINTGNFEVDLEATLLFTDFEVPKAIRANTTVTMDFVLKNSDGAIGFDLPSMTLGDGSPDLPVNQSVTLKLKGEAIQDTTLGTSIGISLFPTVP